MEQPPDFIAQGESRKVCRRKKCLYRLKQSPIIWFERFASVVKTFGLSRSQNDHLQEKRLLLVVYVDDIIITGDNAQWIADLNCYLQKHFRTKDFGSLCYFLCIKVVRSKREIILSQR